MSKREFAGWAALRWLVLERDEFTCQYCGQHAPNVPLEVDHIVPVAEGGGDEPENLKTSCWACNRGKNALWVHANGAARQVKAESERIVVGDKARVTTQMRVLELLERTGRPMSTIEVQEALKLPGATVRLTLCRAGKRGLVLHLGRGTWSYR